jgi:hypothetical protein
VDGRFDDEIIAYFDANYKNPIYIYFSDGNHFEAIVQQQGRGDASGQRVLIAIKVIIKLG